MHVACLMRALFRFYQCIVGSKITLSVTMDGVLNGSKIVDKYVGVHTKG